MQSVIFIVLALVALQRAEGAKILTEKPNFIHTCRLSDADFGHCLGDNVQAIYREWKDGIPGLKSFGSLDPLHIKRITFSRDANDGITVDGELTNILFTGLSTSVIKETRFDPVKRIIGMEMFAPKMSINPEYSIMGRILGLNVNRKAKATSTIENILMNLKVHYNLQSVDGYTFMDIDKVHLDIKDLSNFSIHLVEIEDSAVIELLNQSWRDVFQLVRPTITSAMEVVMKDRLKKILAYIPATFLIEDLS